METNFKSYINLSQSDLNQAFVVACKHGKLKIVQFLLNSPELKQHADIHFEFDEGLKEAGRQGHLPIVKYLLTSPELKEHADITTSDVDNGDYSSFTDVICRFGQLRILKFLHKSVNSDNTLYVHRIKMFMAAFEAGQMPILDYLIFEQQLGKEEKINDILSSFHSPLGKKAVEELFKFQEACYSKDYDTVKEFIFEKNIERTPAINKFIRFKKEVKHLFEMRELNKKLNIELNYNNIYQKKNKL